MDVFDAIFKRSSTRAYSEKPVPEELVKECIEAARWAPSSCNLQLTEYIVVNDDTLRQTLAKNVTGKFNWARTYIIFVYDPRFTVKRAAAVTSLGASMQNLLLAATARGLAACPMAGFEKDEMLKKILGIPSWYEVGLIMSLGYALDTHTSQQRSRIPLEDMTHWNSYATHRTLNPSTRLSDWSVVDAIEYRRRIAPVYLYGNHNRLAIFPEHVYASVWKHVKEYVSAKNALDLVTYDGAFLTGVVSEQSSIQWTASDHVDYTLQVHGTMHPSLKCVAIGADNRCNVADGVFDLITLIHKLEFSPGGEELLKEAVRLLAPQGTLCISTSRESWKKKVLYRFQAFKKKWLKRELVNSYENNPYYKIGPMSEWSPGKIRNVVRKLGLVEVASGMEVVSKSGTFPHRYFWTVYKKK